MTETVTFQPQPGPQTEFLSCPADLVIYGGAAGGGKTYAMLLEPLRHIYTWGFSGVIFRRTMEPISYPGGLYDVACSIFQACGARPNRQRKSFAWKSGATLKLAHLNKEGTKYTWQGPGLAFVGFEELTHFTKTQFTYMLSRLRSTCGVKPYVRATCNPDPDSWVLELLEWFIHWGEPTKDTGKVIKEGDPIPSRAGVIRYFTTHGKGFVTGDTAKEVFQKTGKVALTYTFIPAKLEDNPILDKGDPSYRQKLAALEEHERAALEGGNWAARPPGVMYSRRDFEVVETMPKDIVKKRRAWDFAATSEKEAKEKRMDADNTASALLGQRADGKIIILDWYEERVGPEQVMRLPREKAKEDGRQVSISLEQEPGSSGKITAQALIRDLVGFDVKATHPTGSKIERSKPFRAQVKAGNVQVLKGPNMSKLWNALESFGGSGHDDLADAIHHAFNDLSEEAQPRVRVL